MNKYLNLFLTFAKIGACTFGGGYAMLPILQRELVETRGWVSEDQLVDYYAVGQCTPGIIAVNTATFVGASQAGVAGGVIATLGLVFPSLIIILIIAAFLRNFMHIEWVTHAFNGIRAGVVGLVLPNVIKLTRSGVTDAATGIIWAVTLILAFVGAFVPMPNGAFGVFLDCLCSPVVLIVLAGAAGLSVRGAKGGLGQ